VRLGKFDDRVGFQALGAWVDDIVALFPNL
jgi:hypothetical protein